MALSIQTAYCVLQNQHFDNEQLMKDDLSCFQTVDESVTNTVDSEDFCKLIRKHQSGLEGTGISGCVCVLLPNISDHTTLKNITSELLDTLGKAPNVEIFLYPYGEPSFLMAISRIQREIQAGRSAWVLALNVARVDEIHSNDSVVLAFFREQSSGLTSGMARIDLAAIRQETAVEKVVTQLGVSSQKTISDMALTIDGVEDPAWLHCMSGLSPWVTLSSKYHFVNLKFGTSGACNGLLKTLYLYLQQRRHPNAVFQALQLDIEPDGYVAGTLFGWSNE